MTKVSKSDFRRGEKEEPELAAEDSIVRAIRELRAGIDPEGSFKKVFERYYSIMVRFFSKRGLSRDACQDMAQEVFLRIYRSIDSYRSDGSFEAWMFQIAANIYRNKIRDQNTIKRRAQEDSLENLFGEAIEDVSGEKGLFDGVRSNPLESYLEKERSARLWRALQDLPEQMRRCVLLRTHQGLKYREIAAVMHISIETVKAHLYQARNRLKRDLEKHGRDTAQRGAP